MRTIDVVYDIPASPERVFALMTDFQQLPRWRFTIQGLQVEPTGPTREGTRVSSTVRGVVRPMIMTNEVQDLDPERRFYRDRYVAGPFPCQGTWHMIDHDGGTRIVWHTEYEGRGLWVLLGPLLGRAIRGRQLRDLANVSRALAESSSAATEQEQKVALDQTQAIPSRRPSA